MNMIKGFLAVFSGIRLLSIKGIRRYAIVPILVNIIIFSLAIYVATEQFNVLMDRFLGSISWLPDILNEVLQWILWPLFALMILVVIYYSFTILANLIAAPFNAMLAQKVEDHLRGESLRESHESFTQITYRTFGSEIKKYMHMAKWLIALIIITIIPGLNVLAPFAWVLYGAWMLSLEYIDYSMGNHGMYFKDELNLLRKHRLMGFGFGGGVMLLTMIPVINLIAMPASVAGGAKLWVSSLSTDKK